MPRYVAWLMPKTRPQGPISIHRIALSMGRKQLNLIFLSKGTPSVPLRPRLWSTGCLGIYAPLWFRFAKYRLPYYGREGRERGSSPMMGASIFFYRCSQLHQDVCVCSFDTWSTT